MPAINEVLALWPLLAAVLSLGFFVGWFAREIVLRIRRGPVLERLLLADKMFLINEQDIARQVEATDKHIALMRSISESSAQAADLASDQMRDFLERFIDIYGENAVPQLIRDASDGVKRLAGAPSPRP